VQVLGQAYRIPFAIEESEITHLKSLLANDPPPEMAARLNIGAEAVVTDGNGDFGPVAIWTVDSSAAGLKYDIVADVRPLEQRERITYTAGTISELHCFPRPGLNRYILRQRDSELNATSPLCPLLVGLSAPDTSSGWRAAAACSPLPPELVCKEAVRSIGVPFCNVVAWPSSKAARET
jgi:hypothetical protein